MLARGNESSKARTGVARQMKKAKMIESLHPDIGLAVKTP